MENQARPDRNHFPFHAGAPIRPTSWLAVRTLESETVRAALTSQGEFVISPRVNGWVIVTGRGLPNPVVDVDRSFHFLTAVSRRLGHLQFFHMENVSGHHSWARLDDGCVTRAYAWAGETIWNQGDPTQAERRLRMNCHDYGETTSVCAPARLEDALENVGKIPLLAARWSLDPEILHRYQGHSGDASPFY